MGYRWGETLVLLMYTVAVSMPSLLIVGKRISPLIEVNPEWLKGFEVHLRSRGCSWNTVSTYLRTFRAVYNRAVDLRKAPYIPHLFRSVYTALVPTINVRWVMRI